MPTITLPEIPSFTNAMTHTSKGHLSDGPIPNRSARTGMRVLLALATLGLDEEHQVAEVARATGLRAAHASRMLLAAVDEGFIERGSRHGTYRLTGELFRSATGSRSSTPLIRQTLESLHQETALAVAYHEPRWRPGRGMYLELVDTICPDPTVLDLLTQEGDLRQTAAGRVALVFTSGSIGCDQDGQRLHLEPRLMEATRTSRVAAGRSGGARTMATPVMRGETAVATLTVAGPATSFDDPLAVQEYAVLLRRTALCAATGSTRPFPQSLTRPTAPSRPGKRISQYGTLSSTLRAI